MNNASGTPVEGTQVKLFTQVISWGKTNAGHGARLLTRPPILAMAIVLLLALWSRSRYIFDTYNYTFGSGDAHGILLKALFISKGILTPPAELGSIFDTPPLLPLLIAAFSRLFNIPIHSVPFVLTPFITAVALLALFAILHRVFGLLTAFLAVGLIALLPRFSFDSTEPEKTVFVLSFFVLALFFLYQGQTRRPLLTVAGFFMGLSLFSHTTGLIFLPVFALSLLVLPWASGDRVLDRYSVLALAIPLFFLGVYFLLSKAIAPPNPVSAQANESASLLPSLIQRQWDTLYFVARGGFQDSAWNVYFDAIRRHVSTPIYALGIAGFGTAAIAAWRQQRYEIIPLILWMVVVTLAFGVQYPGYSHGSRYPSYVAPVFVTMAIFFAISAAGAIRPRVPQAVRGLTVPLLLAALLVPTVDSYVQAENPGLRGIYQPHRVLATYLATNGVLDDGSHILYLGWPSITYHLLEQKPEYKDQIHTFGWGLRDLSDFTPEFIRQNNVRYYAYNHVGSDYKDSANKVRALLEEDFRLELVGTFRGRDEGVLTELPARGSYIALYEVRPLVQPGEP